MRAYAHLLAAFGVLATGLVQAEPYFAVREGFKCVQCHANPTGGGLRNAFGNGYAQTVLPARRLGADEPWSGVIGSFFAIGGNLRASYQRTDVSGQPSPGEFDVEEARVFLDVSVIPGRLSVYVDELVAPGNADNREAHARLWIRENALYLKAGRLYLPFGWRLEDDGAFVRQLSGIGMTTPDTGAELGVESGPWTAQLAVSNGTAGAPERDSGKQVSLRAQHVRASWRAGASVSLNDADGGDRNAFALHAALRTGPVVWLGEVDYVEDDSLGAAGRTLRAALGEANWLVRRGHNVKLSAEYLDPDDDVDEDEQNRFSLVYELTPIEFLQLRIGARIYDGIPQSALQNREQYFVQLHGFF